MTARSETGETSRKKEEQVVGDEENGMVEVAVVSALSAMQERFML